MALQSGARTTTFIITPCKSGKANSGYFCFSKNKKYLDSLYILVFLEQPFWEEQNIEKFSQVIYFIKI